MLERVVALTRRAALGVRWDDMQTAGPGQQGPSAQALAAPTLTAVQILTFLFAFPQPQHRTRLTTQASEQTAVLPPRGGSSISSGSLSPQNARQVTPSSFTEAPASRLAPEQGTHEDEAAAAVSLLLCCPSSSPVLLLCKTTWH